MVKISGKTQGILYIIIAAFGFAGMSLFVKLAGDLPSLQKAFFRNFVALIYISIKILKEKVGFIPKKESAVPLFFYITECNVLNYTENIVSFTVVLPLFFRHARTFMQLLRDRQTESARRKYAQQALAVFLDNFFRGNNERKTEFRSDSRRNRRVCGQSADYKTGI